MTTRSTGLVLEYDIDLVYPGRVVVAAPTGQHTVILPEDPYWQFRIRVPTSRGFAGSTLYDRLKSGQSVSLDMHDMRVPTIPTGYVPLGSTLGDDYLELTLPSDHQVEDGQYLMYHESMYRVFWVGTDRIRVMPRPSLNPSISVIQPVVDLDVILADLSGPSRFSYPNWNGIELTLRTLT